MEKNSPLPLLITKILYYRFGELKMDYRSPAGFDRTRNAVIGHKNFDLTYLEEAYTTERWLVRIYRFVIFDMVDLITLRGFSLAFSISFSSQG